jgi:hypothetical protein
MATDQPNPPEGFTKAETPDQTDDYDTDWIDRPSLGELVQGILLARKPDRGKYDTTVLELRLTEPCGDVDADECVALWSTAGIDKQLDSADVERGEEIAITCEDTHQRDGEERREYAVYTK